jgi:NAD-dependent DNA ligase
MVKMPKTISSTKVRKAKLSNKRSIASKPQRKKYVSGKKRNGIKKEIGRIGVESRKSLKELLESLAAAYYYDEPLVSDKVYEELLDYYNSMEKAYGKKNFSGIDKTNSKREKIKYSNTKLLFTLSKQKDMEEFKEWEKKIRSNKLLNNELGSKNLSNEFIITPKYDGNSFGVQYRYSKKNDKVIVVKVITRGKDNEGLDYTDDLKELFKIDLSKSKPLRKIILSNSIINFEIQYEIVMTKSNLDVYNKAINASYKNCRSVLNSILKRDEFSKYIQYLDFVPLNFHNDKEYILYSNGIDRRNDGFLRPNHRK